MEFGNHERELEAEADCAAGMAARLDAEDPAWRIDADPHLFRGANKPVARANLRARAGWGIVLAKDQQVLRGIETLFKPE